MAIFLIIIINNQNANHMLPYKRNVAIKFGAYKQWNIVKNFNKNNVLYKLKKLHDNLF